MGHQPKGNTSWSDCSWEMRRWATAEGCNVRHDLNAVIFQLSHSAKIWRKQGNFFLQRKEGQKKVLKVVKERDLTIIRKLRLRYFAFP